MATTEELNQLYQEAFGRNVDSSGASTYANTSVDALRDILANSEEKQRMDWSDTEATAFTKGEAFYAEGWDTNESFRASEEGELVFVRAGQATADGYEDVTDSLGDNYKEYLASKGLIAIVDQGKSSGLLGLVDRTLGIDFFSEAWDRAMPNEAKVTYGPTANLIIGGSDSVNDAGDSFASVFGTNREEYAQYGGVVEKAVVAIAATVLSPFTGGASLYAIPAFNAIQSSAYKLSDLPQYRGIGWSDIAESAAWDTAAAAAGGGVGSALINTAQFKAQGGDWSDAAVYGAAGVIGAGNLSSEQAALLAAAASGLTGGDEKDMLAAAGGSYAGSYVGASLQGGTYDKWAQAAKSATQAGIGMMGTGEDTGESSRAQDMNQLISGLASAGSSYNSSGEMDDLHPFSGGSYTQHEFDALKNPNTWVSQSIYNDQALDGKWFNPLPDVVKSSKGNDYVAVRQDSHWYNPEFKDVTLAEYNNSMQNATNSDTAPRPVLISTEEQKARDKEDEAYIDGLLEDFEKENKQR